MSGAERIMSALEAACLWTDCESGVRIPIRFPDGSAGYVTREEYEAEMAKQRASLAQARARVSRQYEDPEGAYIAIPHVVDMRGWPDRAAPRPDDTGA